MRCYRWAWRICWAALALLLVLAGLIVGSVGALLVTGVLTGLIAAVAAAALLQHDGGTRVPVSQHGRMAGSVGLRVGSVAGVLAAWAAAVGSLVVPLLVAAALTSPPVLAALLGRDRWPSRRVATAAAACPCGCADPVSVEEVRPLLALLSNAELVRAWRLSLARLQQTRSAAEWTGLVVLRTAYLAELESRDPVAVRRWLDSHPAAATAPDLSRPTGHQVLPTTPPPEHGDGGRRADTEPPPPCL